MRSQRLLEIHATGGMRLPDRLPHNGLPLCRKQEIIACWPAATSTCFMVGLHVVGELQSSRRHRHADGCHYVEVGSWGSLVVAGDSANRQNRQELCKHVITALLPILLLRKLGPVSFLSLSSLLRPVRVFFLFTSSLTVITHHYRFFVIPLVFVPLSTSTPPSPPPFLHLGS
jgi:hypothetical protein